MFSQQVKCRDCEVLHLKDKWALPWSSTEYVDKCKG